MRYLSVFILFIFLFGCASKTQTQFYVIKPLYKNTFENDETQVAYLSKKSIGIGPLFLPSWMTQSFSVASYERVNQLRLPTYHIWAGELESMILNAVASDLSHTTGWKEVWSFPWDNRHRPEYQVRINIEEFSGVLSESAKLNVKWTLLSDFGKKEEFVKIRKFEKTLADDTHETYTEVLNELLAEFTFSLSKDLVDFEAVVSSAID